MKNRQGSVERDPWSDCEESPPTEALTTGHVSQVGRGLGAEASAQRSTGNGIPAFYGFAAEARGMLWGFIQPAPDLLGVLFQVLVLKVLPHILISVLPHILNLPLEPTKPNGGLETTMRVTSNCVFSVSWASRKHCDHIVSPFFITIKSGNYQLIFLSSNCP